MDNARSETPPARLLPLAGFYVLYFGTVGITLPFLPAYLTSLNFSATEVGVLLALGPAMAIVSPPIFGGLADRTARPDRVLTLISFGTALGFLPLALVSGFPPVFAAFLAYQFFYASIVPIIDSLALAHVAKAGGSYAGIRLFGSLGFILASIGFGFSVETVDRRAIFVCLAFIGAFALWSLSIRAPGSKGIAPHPLAGIALLRLRDLAILLGATCLHWIACAPYHGTFSIRVKALGHAPSVVGLATSAGVVAELLVMLLYPRFAGRIAPRHLLALSFGASAVRWSLMGFAESAPALIAIQTLHALTFGTFYLASVAFMERRVPPELRASGQALFVAVTFGIGGLLGYLSAGVGYDLLGGGRLFLVGGAVEVLAMLLVLNVHPPAEISAPVGRPNG